MRRAGFSLVEALVAVVVLAVGVVGAVGALSDLTRNESRARETLFLNKIAQEKLDELEGTGDVDLAPLDGDFEEADRQGYSWSLETEPSDVENLTIVRLTVNRTGEDASRGVSITTLRYVAPQTSETGGEETQNRRRP
jgi:prepilin-type N-terminal cleavage/methylation domain-containing protein